MLKLDLVTATQGSGIPYMFIYSTAHRLMNELLFSPYSRLFMFKRLSEVLRNMHYPYLMNEFEILFNL